MQRGKKVLKITKLTLALIYTNCQLVSNRESDHESMMANQLRNRNNLVTWKSIKSPAEVRKIARFVVRSKG